MMPSASRPVVAIVAAVGGLMGSGLLLIFGGGKLTQTKAFSRMTLTDTQEKEQGYTVNFYGEPMVGKTGNAFTVLRPGGKVIIDGKIFDAFTRGEYVEKDDAIEVISIESSTLRVKKITS